VVGYAFYILKLQSSFTDSSLQNLATEPSEYPPFLRKPEKILSLIYSTLFIHIERHSPRFVSGAFAYLLTVTSAEYFESIGRSVGFVQEVSSRRSATAILRLDADEAPEDEVEDVTSTLPDGSTEFPDFFTPRVAETITRARMSLKLLRTAQTNRHMIQPPSVHRGLAWLWTSEDVHAASSGKPHQAQGPLDTHLHPLGSQPRPESGLGQVLSAFKIFDLEPGTHASKFPLSERTHDALEKFLDDFPEELPALTPTLPHLCELVMAPLLDHCHAVSSSLLELVLSPTSDLHLLSHLRLIRDYLLLASPTFKWRLSQALLSDHDDWQFEGNAARALAQRSRPTTPTVSGDTWAVGLGLGLSERTSWPPGGADLSFYLRTVIVDSLEIPPEHNEDELVTEEVATYRHILAEAEFRLGFSIRDLPTGAGRDKWLDPCCEWPFINIW
jgi:hypothetical protein